MLNHEFFLNLVKMRQYVAGVGSRQVDLAQVVEREWLLAQIHMATKRIEELQNRLDELDGKPS